jgi:hypothetical protein
VKFSRLRWAGSEPEFWWGNPRETSPSTEKEVGRYVKMEHAEMVYEDGSWLEMALNCVKLLDFILMLLSSGVLLLVN